MLKANAQEFTSQPIGFSVVGGFSASYGPQSIAIPPFMLKANIGINMNVQNFMLYALPGITIGIAPTGYYHVEAGVGWHFITADYSWNWQGLNGNTYRNQNINVGVKFRISSKHKNDIWLWLKYGRCIESDGYNEEHTLTWDGHNLELRLLINIFQLN